MEVGLDAGLGEDLVDECAIRVAVAIDDGHLVETNAALGPAQAGARRLPHLADGVGRVDQRDILGLDARAVVRGEQPRGDALQ